MKILWNETIKGKAMSDKNQKLDMEKVKANTISHDDYMNQK